MIESASNSTALPSFEETNELFYPDGDVIKQKWHVGFIILAYVTAFMGAYSAIRLLEHGLWRSERERQNASSRK